MTPRPKFHINQPVILGDVVVVIREIRISSQYIKYDVVDYRTEKTSYFSMSECFLSEATTSEPKKKDICLSDDGWRTTGRKLYPAVLERNGGYQAWGKEDTEWTPSFDAAMRHAFIEDV